LHRFDCDIKPQKERWPPPPTFTFFSTIEIVGDILSRALETKGMKAVLI
jgi:hypothetical protein